MRPKKYVKNPVDVQAMNLRCDNAEALAKWCGGRIEGWTDGEKHTLPELAVPSAIGRQVATVGDYVVQEIDGQFYVVSPDIFVLTYSETR